MKLPKLNVKLLRRIQKYITKFPKRYNQGNWGTVTDGDYVHPKLCNTQACIAGWAVFLTVSPKTRKKWYSDIGGIPRKAQKILGLTEEESSELFDTNPGPDTGVEGAVIGCRRIDELIASRKKGRKAA